MGHIKYCHKVMNFSHKYGYIFKFLLKWLLTMIIKINKYPWTPSLDHVITTKSTIYLYRIVTASSTNIFFLCKYVFFPWVITKFGLFLSSSNRFRDKPFCAINAESALFGRSHDQNFIWFALAFNFSEISLFKKKKKLKFSKYLSCFSKSPM